MGARMLWGVCLLVCVGGQVREAEGLVRSGGVRRGCWSFVRMVNSSFFVIEEAIFAFRVMAPNTGPRVVCPVNVEYDHAVAASHSVGDLALSGTGHIEGHCEDGEDKSVYLT
jgi:hypothetical protein